MGKEVSLPSKLLKGKAALNAGGYQEAQVLIKLLPYFDIHLDKSDKESNELRKILGIAKSEAEMIFLRK